MISRRQLLAAAAFCAPGFGRVRASPARDDAMWVWEEPVLAPDGALADFVAKRGVETLYLYVSPAAADALLSRDRAALDAVGALAAKGLRLYAVAGEPDWARGVADLPGHAALLARLVQTSRLFDGLHFDVEPNALPEWRDSAAQSRLAVQTLRFYELAKMRAPGVRIDAAVNPIYAATPTRDGSFLRLLSERVDSVSLMAYRAQVARAVNWARPAVAQIAAAGRPWRMGVLAGEGEAGTSWRCASPGAFQAAVHELRDRVAQDFATTRCAGLAFQDYRGLAGLFAGAPPCAG